MNADTGSNVPKWFTVVAILALAWNLFGVMAYMMQVNMTADDIAALPAAEQALYNNYPAWAMIAFGVAVFGGTLGSLLLVLKKNLAGPVLQLSLIAALIQMAHSFFIAKAYEVYGPTSLVLPLAVIVIAALLVLLAARAKKNGWTG